MNSERDAELPAPLPASTDPPLWHVLRPEIRLSALRWADLKDLAARQHLGADDYIWHPAWETWRGAREVPNLLSPPTPAQHVQPRTSTKPSKASLKDRARHELRSYIIISGYIWAIVSLLRLHEQLIAETYSFSIQSQGYAVVTALILGKVVMIGEALHLGAYLTKRAPALSILIRSLLFAVAILGFHALEELVFALWDGSTWTAAIESPSPDTVRRSVLTALIMSIALVPYFLIKEIEERTGERDLLLLAIGLRR